MKTTAKRLSEGTLQAHLPLMDDEGVEHVVEVYLSTFPPSRQSVRLSSFPLLDDNEDAIASVGDMTIKEAANFLGTGSGTALSWLKPDKHGNPPKLDLVPGSDPMKVTGESIEQVYRGSPERVLKKGSSVAGYHRAEPITVGELQDQWRNRIERGSTEGVPDTFVIQETIRQVVSEMRGILPHVKPENARDKLFAARQRLAKLVEAS